jgi:hypothetical protein
MSQLGNVRDRGTFVQSISVVHRAKKLVRHLAQTNGEVLAVTPSGEVRVIAQGSLGHCSAGALGAVRLHRQQYDACQAAHEQDLEPECRRPHGAGSKHARKVKPWREIGEMPVVKKR